MCFGLFRAANNCIRLICGILCCMLCGGPICLIIGIVLLASDNNREDNVNEYNSVVASYNTAPITSWVPASVGVNSFSLFNQAVTVYGNLQDVQPATSRILSTQGGPSNTASYSLTNVAPFARSGITQSRWFLSTAYCDNSWGCSNSAMNNYCVANFGPSASFNSGGYCSGRGNCGQCRYAAYLSEYCVVVDSEPTTGNTYQQSARYGSCFYPFGQNDQLFRTSSSGPFTSIYYTVRQSNDPFIALQRLTEGEMDFGTLREDERNAGIALVVVGSIIIVCMIIGGICVYRHVSRTKDHPAGQPNSGHAVVSPPPGGAAYYPTNGTAHPVPPPNNINYGYADNGYYSPNTGIPMQQMAPAPQQQQMQQPPPQPNYVTNTSNGYGYANDPQPYGGNNNLPPTQYNVNNMPPADGYGYGNTQSGGATQAYGYA